MKKLNKTGTKIFLRLIAALGDKPEVTLPLKGFGQITVERLGDVIMPEGKGEWYSITQLINGKLHAQMNFIVIDNREYLKETDLIKIYPQQYTLEDDTPEISIIIEQGKFKNCIATWQTGHCRTATLWLEVLKEKGIFKH